MNTSAPETVLSPENVQKTARGFYMAIPFFLLVPAAFWLAFRMGGVALNWTAFGLGALGWWLALVLRAPIAMVVKRFWPDRMLPLVGGASGPCEEIVRVTLLLLTASSFAWAASVGQGWAAIEVLFTIVTGFLQISLMSRTDEKSRKAREFLADQMGRVQGVKGAQFLGIVERIFASGLHIGFTLMVAAYPLLAILLIPAHSAFNLTLVKISKKASMWRTQAYVAVGGTCALALGLLLSAGH